ncbi:Rad33p Ecym_4074 [Eremothecium cymbalariae DBVPG|uniref:DNA repair protein RAD33 n=1 Tax=Eremothecium cymbalariae (strain CBS 270.75 / DBVPG 7215 / KCTC 17166 / NRRL Y-17582) TaxID=931890 RepID=G8JT01_ERECY|nr:hypothetical protein Ecym_4074 [Eremothecium cymbalariae DBVPG\
MDKLSYDTVSSFMRAKIPQEIEDELLMAYANCTEGQDDLNMEDIGLFFEELGLSKQWYKMVRKDMVCIEGTRVVDFEKLMDITYRLLVFMDNERTIDEQWSLLVRYSGRDEQFPQVKLRNHVLSAKDLQKCMVQVQMSGSAVVDMVSGVTKGPRVYVTYLDFAYLLGKLGYLRF